MAADPRHTAALGGAAVHRYIFAEDIVAADFQPRLFTFIGQVLGFAANRAKRKEAVVRPDFRGAVDHNMRNQFAVFPQFHARAHNAIWPNGAG